MDPFIGEVRMFAGSYAPRDWVFADGQLLPISQYTTVFAIVGNVYGGDGRATFGVPNLKERSPMHRGDGPGLTTRRLGQTGGSELASVTVGQMPSHSHAMLASSNESDSGEIVPHLSVLAAGMRTGRGGVLVPMDTYKAPDAVTLMNAKAVTLAGGDTSHYNRQPFQAIYFIFCVDGVFPPRPN